MILAAVASSCFEASAQPLGTSLTYQGELRLAGQPAAGPVDLRFTLFDAATLGAPVGSTIERLSVALGQGRFTQDLDFGGSAFGADARWLEIQVRNPAGGGVYVTLNPRQRVTPAPAAQFAASAATSINATQFNGQSATFYQNAANLSTGTIPDARLAGAYTGALTLSNAGNAITGVFSGSGAALTNLNADRLDGLDSTAFLQAIPVPLTLSGNNNSHIIWGENASAAPGASGVRAISTALTGFVYGVEATSNSTGGTGVFGAADASTGNTYGGHFFSLSTSGRGVSGEATAGTGPAYGVYGSSSSTSGRGVFGNATAATGTVYGVWGQSISPDGIGVYGTTTANTGATFGGQFESSSTSGTGVSGYALSLTGTTYGVWGQVNSTAGTGVWGRATATGGTTYGGQFTSDSTAGRGVLGDATATSGFTQGVWGRAASSSGRGVYGLATATSGSTFGVFGASVSTSPNAASVIGVGNGVAAPGSPRAAALRIESGAITVAGSPKPADRISVTGWTCLLAWDDAADCNNLAYGRAPIGATADGTITNPLIRADSLLYLTVRGAPPAPGTSCSAQVISQAPGTATVRVTVLGGPTCQPCGYTGSVDVNYLIINPQ